MVYHLHTWGFRMACPSWSFEVKVKVISRSKRIKMLKKYAFTTKSFLLLAIESYYTLVNGFILSPCLWEWQHNLLHGPSWSGFWVVGVFVTPLVYKMVFIFQFYDDLMASYLTHTAMYLPLFMWYTIYVYQGSICDLLWGHQRSRSRSVEGQMY